MHNIYTGWRLQLIYTRYKKLLSMPDLSKKEKYKYKQKYKQDYIFITHVSYF